MEHVPAYVSAVFMITAFVTVGIFLFAIKSSGDNSRFGRAVLFLIPFWLIFQYFLASTGFFQNTESFPPRLFFFGLGPALVLIAVCFAAARRTFVSSLPLAAITVLHTVRIPVEFTLSALYSAHVVPGIMTFHGNNLDVLSGLTAPIAFFLALRPNAAFRPILIAWNLAALGLLLNVVVTAILCIPSPIQKLAFDQPNIAVLYSPYIWLPTVIVPIVFFCHLAALYQLMVRPDGKPFA